MVTSVTKGGGHRNCPKNVRLSKTFNADMTVHWKALEELFLMVPFFDSTIFGEEIHFLKKTSVLKELMPLFRKCSSRAFQ
jgi:hypothetical protein